MTVADRRTQAERRSSTRARLLSATIESLVEAGYTRTTTTEVTRRAGVSQGALFKHFATKSALVAAAAEQLFADLIADFDGAFERSTQASPAPASPPVIVALHRLWEVFCTPALQAVYRLYVEAPVDAELRAALVPVVRKHEANVQARARDLLPQLATSPAHEALFGAVMFAMQGMAVQRSVHLDAAKEARILEQFESLAVTFLGDGRPTHAGATTDA